MIGGAGADTFMFEGVVNKVDGIATILDFNAAQGDTIEISKDFIDHLLTKSGNFNGQAHYSSIDDVYMSPNSNSTFATFGVKLTRASEDPSGDAQFIDLDLDLFNIVLPPSQNTDKVLDSIESALRLQFDLTLTN
jgi:Ca2+-binding RTX toxin-like protein